MLLIVMPGDAHRPVTFAKGEHEGRQVVGEIAIVEAGGPQVMTHGHIQEEPLAWHHDRTKRHESLEKFRRVEQRVGALFAEPPLQLRATLSRPLRECCQHHIQITRQQVAAQIGTDHGFAS